MSLATHSIAKSRYGFSATRVADLGATEYTLVAIAADTSGSVHPFLRDIEGCLKEVVRACRHSPRADQLMMRVVSFDDDLDEMHGFKPLPGCDVGDYDSCLRAGGTTALIDAAHNAVASVATYGRDLSDNDFDVNAIVFVITDGCDNASAAKASDVVAALEAARQEESLESITTILVGVNVKQRQVSRELKRVRKAVGFDRYVELDRADASALAKLADFVSRSISAQSQALGQGGPGPALTF